MAQTSALKELESNAIQDVAVSIQESETSDVINEILLIEVKNGCVLDQTLAGFYSKILPVNSANVDYKNEVFSQATVQAYALCYYKYR
jgi:hypothetical protein